MAHGFLSYNPDRDPSGIETFLEKKFDEQTDRLKGFIVGEVRRGITNALFNLRTKAPRTPKPYSWKKDDAPPVQRMLSGGGQRALTGSSTSASAVTAEHYGGELARAGFSGKPLKPEGFAADRIVNTTATNLGVERDLGGGDDMFVKRMEPVGGGIGDDGSVAIVQAINRLENTTMGIGAAIQAQTQVQRQIAQTQQQEAEKLGRKSLAAAEESSIEQGGDLSSNIAYQALGANGMKMMGRGGGGGGGGLGLGMGVLGGKVAARKTAMAIGRRGGSRAGRRLGIALGGRFSKGLGKTLGKKLGGKAIGKIAGTGLAKALGKKIPLVGLGLGAIFAAQRAMQGDFVGAGLELASGAASTVPGVGTAASVGLDAALMAKDMRGMADGGFLTEPTNVIAGEAGAEGFFPLEGARGKKTFTMFGEGILDAQKKNKRVFGKLQAEGFKEYYDNQDGWSKLIDFFKELLPWYDNKDFNILNPTTWWKRDSEEETDDGGGGDDRPNGNVRAIRHHRANDAQDLTGDTFMPVATRKTEAGNPAKNQHFGAPRDGGDRSHVGIDITDDYSSTDDPNDQYAGGPVVAYKTGIVEGIKPPTTPGADNGELSIKHPDGTKTRYYHVNPKAGLKNGDEVFGGQHIADMTRYYRGGTEQTHLHFELYNAAGDIVDPTRAIQDADNRISSPLSDAQAELYATQGIDPRESSTNMDQYEKIRAEREKLTALGSSAELTSAISSNEGIKKAISENRSSTSRERFIIPGVGSAKTYTDMFIRGGRKNTFFNNAGEEVTMDEMLELIKKRNAELEKQQIELMNRTSDASGADQLNSLSTDTIASAATGGTTIINNYNTTTGGNSSGGDDVMLGTNFNSMGTNPIFNTMALRNT